MTSLSSLCSSSWASVTTIQLAVLICQGEAVNRVAVYRVAFTVPVEDGGVGNGGFDCLGHDGNLSSG